MLKRVVVFLAFAFVIGHLAAASGVFQDTGAKTVNGKPIGGKVMIRK